MLPSGSEPRRTPVFRQVEVRSCQAEAGADELTAILLKKRIYVTGAQWSRDESPFSDGCNFAKVNSYTRGLPMSCSPL